jgi:hypothetical protein
MDNSFLAIWENDIYDNLSKTIILQKFIIVGYFNYNLKKYYTFLIISLILSPFWIENTMCKFYLIY